MDYSRGYTASYYMTIVDPASWRDIDTVNIISGSMSCEDEGLRQSADIKLTDFDRNKEQWVRIRMIARQNGDTENIPLFTGLASVSGGSTDDKNEELTLEGYSVLYPAEDIPLDRGWYAPAEIPAGEIIEELLSVTPAPVVVQEGAPRLTDYIVAEDNETHLTMVDKILEAIGWRIRIDGSGTIYVVPPAERASATFGGSYDVIEPPIDTPDGWFDCPNCFKATSDDVSAIARDDSEDNSLSTVNRGREKWIQESDCSLNEDESLEEYAMRRLKEEQSSAGSISYGRRFVPDLMPSDLVMINYPEQGVRGIFKIGSQDIDFDYGTNVSEEVSVWAGSR